METVVRSFSEVDGIRGFILFIILFPFLSLLIVDGAFDVEGISKFDEVEIFFPRLTLFVVVKTVVSGFFMLVEG